MQRIPYLIKVWYILLKFELPSHMNINAMSCLLLCSITYCKSVLRPKLMVFLSFSRIKSQSFIVGIFPASIGKWKTSNPAQWYSSMR